MRYYQCKTYTIGIIIDDGVKEKCIFGMQKIKNYDLAMDELNYFYESLKEQKKVCDAITVIGAIEGITEYMDDENYNADLDEFFPQYETFMLKAWNMRTGKTIKIKKD